MQNKKFDLLIIGGGSVGCGTALDAASRGLSVALVEGSDFGSGTSSKSTKLVHGGVRYLEKAVFNCDPSQYYLVKEALSERKFFLKNAVHLTRSVPIIIPVYQWYKLPYYYFGMKTYDWLAGGGNLKKSHYLSPGEVLRDLPFLKKEGLWGGIVYYDGQFDDAKTNVTLAMTAAKYGACVANYTEVVELIKEGKKLRGVKVYDHEDEKEFSVFSDVVVNATGVGLDRLRQMDDQEAKPLLCPSSGVHIVLDNKKYHSEMGFLVPQTEDGRVLFMLPWKNQMIVGTTDHPAEPAFSLRPKQEEVDYILRNLQNYCGVPIAKEEIVSVWSGVRPLVCDPKVNNTSELSREHLIVDSESGLVSVGGGKWTTYRKIAQDVVDHCFPVKRNLCRTEEIRLVGSEQGVSDLDVNIDEDVKEHLLNTYGDRAFRVIEIANEGFDKRVVEGSPYLEAEVIYCAREEMACHAIDILARRWRLAFLNVSQAQNALPKVIELMSLSLGWSKGRKQKEFEEGLNWLMNYFVVPLYTDRESKF